MLASASNVSSWTGTRFSTSVTDPAGHPYTLETNSAQQLVLTVTGDIYYWALGGGTGDGTWDVGTSANWAAAAGEAATNTFAQNGYAFFVGDGANTTTITVGSGISAGPEGVAATVAVLTVSNGNFIFDGEPLTLTGGLNIGQTAAAQVSFEQAPSIGGNLVIQESTSSLTVEEGDLSVQQLSNEGNVTLDEGDMSIAQATSEGGNITTTTGGLSLGSGENSFNSLNIAGEVSGNTGSLSLASDSTLGSLSGGGSLEIASGALASLTTTENTTLASLSGAGSLSSSGGLTLSGASSIGNLNLAGQNLSVGSTLSVTGDLTVAGITILNLSPSVIPITLAGQLITAGSLDFTLSEASLLSLGSPTTATSITLLDGANSLAAGTVLELNGLSEQIVGAYTFSVTEVGDDIILSQTRSSSSGYYQQAIGGGHNPQAGAKLLDYAAHELDPAGNLSNNPALSDVIGTIDSYINQGNSSAARQLSSALAGVSASIIGSAHMEELHRQMRSMRNRSYSMCGYDDKASGTCYSAWIEGDMGYSRLDNDGYKPGYTMNTWGGSCGFNMCMGEDWGMGIAFSALSSDLHNNGAADLGKGDLDTYYLNLMMNYESGYWTHNFVATAGLAQASMRRSVTTATGHYTTEGKPDGHSFGFLYELTRIMPLDESNQTYWQPLMTAALMYTQMDGYTESGDDNALVFGRQKNTYASFGLGARMQSNIGQDIMNRDGYLGIHALVKVDAGDRRSAVDVGWAAGGGKLATVESAEPGPVGFELGMSWSMPFMQNRASFFMEAGYEWREHQNMVQASLGVSFKF